MKYLIIIIFIAALLNSCFESPVDPSKDDAKELVQLWKFEHGIVGDAPPVVSGTSVFASGDLYLYALEQENGEPIWQAQIDNNSELQGEKLLLKGDQVVANHLENVRGWNTESGTQEWEYVYSDTLEPRRNGNHSVTDDGYVFTTYNSKILELNMNGELIFEKLLDKNYIVHGVSYFEDTFFTGQTQTVHGALTLGRITAIDAQTGDSLWAYDTENGGFVRAAPIVENGVVYAGAVGNSPIKEFVALDAETGDVIWRQTEHVRTDNFLIGPKYVYVNTGGTLAALDKVNGSIAWRFEWTSSAGLITPVYLEGYVYHSDHNRLFVLDGATGQLVHEEPVPEGGSYFWHLAVSSDKLYAQTSRQLIAYQPWHLREE